MSFSGQVKGCLLFSHFCPASGACAMDRNVVPRGEGQNLAPSHLGINFFFLMHHLLGQRPTVFVPRGKEEL